MHKSGCICAMIALGAAGCQNPAPPASPSQLPRIVNTSVTTAPAHQDACADNLHKLEEYLMLYVAVRNQLPPSLDKLRPLTGGKPLLLACPVSGQSYIYHPEGLVATGDPRVLILYDAVAAHNGKRQAIILKPAMNNQAPVMDVVFITDEILKAFHDPLGAKP